MWQELMQDQPFKKPLRWENNYGGKKPFKTS